MRYWGKEDPLGKRWKLGEEEYTVVGVVKDSGANAIQDRESVEAYLALSDRTMNPEILILHTNGDPATLLRDAHAIEVRPGLHPVAYRMRLPVDQQTKALSNIALIVGTLGATVTLLAAIGIFGLLAFWVAQRTQEIGVPRYSDAAGTAIYGAVDRGRGGGGRDGSGGGTDYAELGSVAGGFAARRSGLRRRHRDFCSGGVGGGDCAGLAGTAYQSCDGAAVGVRMDRLTIGPQVGNLPYKKFAGALSWRGTVAAALEHSQVCAPGADGFAILMGHDPRELMEMCEIVDGPGGEELRQGHDSQFRMRSSPAQVFGLQIQCLECRQVLAAEAGEIVQQLLKRFALTLLRLRETIKGIKGPRFAAVQDDLHARHPVGTLADDQVAHDVERAPGLISFAAARPDVGKAAQQSVQSGGRMGENGCGFGHAKFRQIFHA
jgi:hypothetical protein